jgi:hypothetical protein
MRTEFKIVHYISCKGNRKWKLVMVPEGISDEAIKEELMKDYGYDDAPSEFLYTEPGYGFEDDSYDKWLHLKD